MSVHKEAYEALRNNIICKINDGWVDISLILVLDMVDNHLNTARQRDKECQAEEEIRWAEAMERNQKKWEEKQETARDIMKDAIADRRDLDAREIK